MTTDKRVSKAPSLTTGSQAQAHLCSSQVDARDNPMSATTTFDTTGKALLTISEAAKLLHTSPSSLRRYIGKKLVAVCKPGGKRGKVFIRPADLDAFLQRTRRAAIGE